MASVITFHENLNNTNNLNTYTFNNVNIGTPAADRLVVIGAGAECNGQGTCRLNSITIGGNVSTLIEDTSDETSAGSGEVPAGMGYYNLQTGTTTTVVVDYAMNQHRCGLSVWTITGCDLVHTDSGTDADNVPTGGVSVSLSWAVNSIVVGYYFNASAGSVTWTGLATKDFEEGLEGNSSGHSGARERKTSPGSGQTVSVSGPSDEAVMACYVFNEAAVAPTAIPPRSKPIFFG